MGFLKRLFTLIVCAVFRRRAPYQPIVVDMGPEPEHEDSTEFINELDDDAFTLWVDFLDHCWSLDPAQHHYPRHDHTN